MANEFKYTIRAEDKSREATRSATQNMTGMESAAKKVGQTLTAAFSVTAILAVGRAVARVASDLVQAYAKQEQAERKLAQAVQNNPFLDQRNINSLQSFASELQNITTVGDEASLEIMALAASWGRNEEEIRALTVAAADLSAGLGLDLQTAARGLNNVMEGNVSTLSRYIPELRNLTEEQIASGDAMRVINEQFGGMAEAMRNTTGGALEAFNNSWGDLKENLGGLFNDVLLPVIEALTVIINKLNEAFARRDARRALEDALEGYADVQSIQLAIAAQERKILDAQQAVIDARENYARAQNQYGGSNDQRSQAYLRLAQTNRNDALNALAEQENIMAWLLDYQTRLNAMLPEQITAPDLSLGNSGGSAAAPVKALVDMVVSGMKPVRENMTLLDRETITLGVSFSNLFLGSNQAYKAITESGEALGDLGDEVARNTLVGMERLGDTLTEIDGLGGAAGSRPGPFSTINPELGSALLDAFTPALLSAANQLGNFAALLDPINLLMQGYLSVVGEFLNGGMAPLVGILVQMGRVIGAILLPLMEIMGGVFKALTDLWVWAYNHVFRHIFNVLIGAVNVVQMAFWGFMQAIVNIVNAILPRWAEIDNPMGSRPRSLTDGMLDAISPEDLAATGNAFGGDYTGGAGAQYTTGRNITVNVDINTGYYFGNEREFAIAIRDEIRAAEALGA